MSTLARTVMLFLCVAVASSGSVASTSADASSARAASSDGKIAFVRSVPGRVGCAILAMNADGSDQRRERDNDDDIYLMRSDGSRQRRLTRNRAAVESFVWSPDGRFIAYAFYAGAIYRAPTTGSPRRLLAHVSAAEPGLSWSPDGRYLAYENDTVRNDIYVMTAKGFDERPLTKRFFNFNPSWSPDSRRIAHGFFTRLEGPSRGGIAVIHADGSNRHELTTGNDSFPSWQPVS